MKSFYPNLLTFEFPESYFGNTIDLKSYEKDIRTFCDNWISGKEWYEITTSGSTGKPKIIRISRDQMKASAALTADALGLKEGDSCLICLNTKYIGGKMMLVRALEVGMPMTIIPPVSNPLKRFLNHTAFDFTALVPYQMQTILEESPEKASILSRMKGILVGGAPVSQQLEEMIQKIEAPVFSTYGMTETVSHIALRRLNGPLASGSYKVLPGIETSTDERQCLTIKGNVTNWETIVTNDVVKFIAPGEFVWIGRSDNIINSGGIKIQVENLEREVGKVFCSLKITNRYFITGMPDLQFGSVACLFIEGKLTAGIKEQIKKSLKNSVSKYETPKRIIEIEKFEETESGKIDRISTKAHVINYL